MSRTQKITIPYTPWKFQKQIHQLLDTHRWNVVVCHRRFGKTYMLLNHMIKEAMLCTKEEPQYVYCAPYLRQAKKIAWMYIKRFTAVIPGVKYNEAELRCDLPNGAKITLIGADNAEAHRGIYLDGAVLDEYGNIDPQAYTSVLRPALADRKGWCIFAGTPNGRNHFYELLCRAQEDQTGRWGYRVLRASETKVLNEEELDDLRLIMSEEEYEREMECSFVSGARGAYYAKQLRTAEQDGRITNVPYDTGHEVYTFWDLGINDTTAIWFMQNIGKEIRFIDYYENTGEGMVHYAKVLKEKGYNYGDHFMPHDAASKSIQTGKSTREYAEDLGIKPISVVKRAKDKQAVLAGIESARNLISQCFFDKKKCSRGLSALESYQAEWDEGKKKLGDSPLHDWSSNGSDAFRTFSAGYRPPVKKQTVDQIMSRFNYKGVW